MNLFLDKLRSVASRYPSEESAMEKLALELDLGARHFGSAAEFTLARLAEVAAPTSRVAFARILAECVRAGLLEVRYRVRSGDNGGSLGDFKSLGDVPPEIDDWRTGAGLKPVRPDDIVVIYRLTPHAVSSRGGYAN